MNQRILSRIFIFILLLGIESSLYCFENSEVDSLLLKLSITKEDTAKVNILIKLAEIASWSDIKSSGQYAKQAMQLSEQLNYTKGLALSKFRLAKAFSDYEFDLSENLLLESLEHAKAIDDSTIMAIVYNGLGNLQNVLKNNENALNYYNKSLDIYLRHNKYASAASTYSNIGILHSKIPGDTLCMVYYTKAVEINKKAKNYFWLTSNYMNMGNYNIMFGKLDEGLNYLQQSLKLVEEHNYRNKYPGIYNSLSFYYIKIKDYKESVNYANKALVISKEQNNRIMELKALSHLKEAYYKMSDIENAYRYFEQIKIVSDSISMHNKLKELDFLEMKYKYVEEQKQQELERVLLEAKYYRNERTYLIILSLAGLIIFTFSFLYNNQRNRIHRKNLEQKNTLLEKEKLYKDLEIKNKELTTGVMYSIQKNKVLSTLTEELVEIEKTAIKDETRDAINKISRKIQDSVDGNAWEEFEIRFQQVHIKFYEILAKEYPELTPNEKRLCAFLRLDMSTKEISRITGQSILAIERARNRLRKKLGISNKDINLITFLSQY